MNTHINKVINDIAQNLNEQVINILPIVGNGSVNQIFIVTTDKEKLVNRVNHNRGFDEFIKEKWCIETASAKGVPGPKVIKISEMDGYSYMIQSFLEGAIGTNAEIDKLVVWEEIGKYAKLIHSIPVPGFGLDSSEIMESATSTSNQKLKRYLSYNIESLNPQDKLLELGVLNTDQLKKVKDLFEELIQRQFTFGLNHGDLSLKNVIVSPQNKVSLFDWGSAEAEIVPHHDFGEILKSSLKSSSPEFKSFLNGYGLPDAEYRDIENDIHSLMLLRAIDKLRWAIDRNPADIPAFVEKVKEIFQLNFRE